MRSDRFLLNKRWGLAIVISLFLLCFSSAQAYYTVLNDDEISDWEYSFGYNSNWLNEGHIGWSKGDAPFGTPSHFYVSTSTNTNSHVYVRKEINLTNSTQGII